MSNWYDMPTLSCKQIAAWNLKVWIFLKKKNDQASILSKLSEQHLIESSEHLPCLHQFLNTSPCHDGLHLISCSVIFKATSIYSFKGGFFCSESPSAVHDWCRMRPCLYVSESRLHLTISVKLRQARLLTFTRLLWGPNQAQISYCCFV